VNEKGKKPDLSDPKVRRTEAARMAEQFDRIVGNRVFKSEAELKEFMDELVGKSFDDIEMPEPTPAQKAQDLIYDAWEEPNLAKRIRLARRALELWPDCADAYAVLAAEEESPKEQRRLLEEAVAAGERAVGPETFRDDVGHFWGIHRTRPYMRARAALADLLWAAGEPDAAIAHCRALLRLNPNDNQGNRYTLVNWLLVVGNDRAAVGLVSRYGENAAVMAYAQALLEFRAWGDADRAREALARAFRANRFMPHYLTGLRDTADEIPDGYSPGSVEEAEVFADDIAEAWEATPGAVEWLTGRWRESMSR
jgi:tetratricopeptide (TPR) repeat protein